MDCWNCCRTCLGAESLHPIFQLTKYHEKYSEIIFSVTGLEVNYTDLLPKQMCAMCINFINSSYKFRKKCMENHTMLLNRLTERETLNVKLESNVYGPDNVAIDITDLIKHEIEDNFNDHEESIENFNEDTIKTDCNEEIEFETKVQDIVDKPVELIFQNKERQCKLPDNKKSDTEKAKKEIKKNNKAKAEKNLPKLPLQQVECDYCHKILKSKLSLRNHLKIHTGFDVICEHCGKKFITRRLLLMHCRAKHGYEKTDKCSFCDYRASNAEQVKIHERLHTGEKPFICAVCGAGFHRKSSYLQHVAIHLPDKTVQCDQCPARFKSVTLMKIHRNRHKGPQYSFKCNLCENSFARRRNVTRHLLRIHSVAPADHHINRLKIAK